MTHPCPSCGSANAELARFCHTCGKAILAQSPAPPRLNSVEPLMTSDSAVMYIEDEMDRQQRRVSSSLKTVAIIHWIVAGFCLAVEAAIRGLHNAIPEDLLLQMKDAACRDLLTSTVIFAVIGAIFYALYRRSRKHPFGPAVSGLCLFLAFFLAEGLQNPKSIASGNLFRIIIVLVLVSGVRAGIRHRRLNRQSDK